MKIDNPSIETSTSARMFHITELDRLDRLDKDRRPSRVLS